MNNGLENRIIIYQCKNCLTFTHPKVNICHECLGELFEPVPLTSPGIIYSYTTSFMHNEQIIYAFADFPQNIRLFGKCDFSDAKIGQYVRAYVDQNQTYFRKKD